MIICTSCGVTLTVKHIMTECRAYEEEKTKHKMSTILYEIIGQSDLSA
ncbi:Uncharacterized protein FWK35_00017751 [Aphis craccivora]|uniref:RNase H domain-containing protein n=1 Tax=Aphis craccivora TaxID=307492 RepID=A0A6G0Z2Z7_APHCR|nr:Uncharacterized protein FWK35_00017751 [Aphis craccivora]